MPRKAGPKPIGGKAFKLKLYATDENFVRLEAARRGLTEPALIRELCHFGISLRGAEMKASLSLTKGMREAQQEGMRTVFKEIKEATQRDITAAVKEALAQQPADLAATITQALKEREQRLTEKLDEQAARLGATHAQASNIHLLLNLLLKLFVDLFATQFSLFKFNGWKKVQEDPALLQVYQETHQSLAAVVAQKESELKQARASETA